VGPLPLGLLYVAWGAGAFGLVIGIAGLPLRLAYLAAMLET